MPGEKRKLSKNKLSEPESKRQEIDDEEQSLRLHFSNLSSTENPKVESLLSISDLKVSLAVSYIPVTYGLIRLAFGTRYLAKLWICFLG